MSEILPGLWLGGLDLIYDYEFLQENGITHVLSVIKEDILTPAMVRAHVTHMRVAIHDCDDEPIADYFLPCIEFIQEALGSGGKVYVHCLMGISRSPSIVAAYLMSARCMRVEEALAFIIARRPIVDPNDGFRAALAAFGSK